MLVLAIALTIIVTQVNNELKPGIYAYGNSDDVDYSWIQLNEDHSFTYSRGPFFSYRPTGEYEVVRDELILHTTDGEIVISIKGRDGMNLEIRLDPLMEDGGSRVYSYTKEM